MTLPVLGMYVQTYYIHKTKKREMYEMMWCFCVHQQSPINYVNFHSVKVIILIMLVILSYT